MCVHYGITYMPSSHPGMILPHRPDEHTTILPVDTIAELLCEEHKMCNFHLSPIYTSNHATERCSIYDMPKYSCFALNISLVRFVEMYYIA